MRRPGPRFPGDLGCTSINATNSNSTGRNDYYWADGRGPGRNGLAEPIPVVEAGAL